MARVYTKGDLMWIAVIVFIVFGFVIVFPVIAEVMGGAKPMTRDEYYGTKNGVSADKKVM